MRMRSGRCAAASTLSSDNMVQAYKCHRTFIVGRFCQNGKFSCGGEGCTKASGLRIGSRRCVIRVVLRALQPCPACKTERRARPRRLEQISGSRHCGPAVRFLSGNGISGEAVREALHEQSVGSRPWSAALCSEKGARRPASPRSYHGNPRIYPTRIPPTVAHGACRRGGAALARADPDT